MSDSTHYHCVSSISQKNSDPNDRLHRGFMPSALLLACCPAMLLLRDGYGEEVYGPFPLLEILVRDDGRVES